LDRWRFWRTRIDFDIDRRKTRPGIDPSQGSSGNIPTSGGPSSSGGGNQLAESRMPPQVEVRCNYCQSFISMAARSREGRPAGLLGGANAATRPKVRKIHVFLSFFYFLLFFSLRCSYLTKLLFSASPRPVTIARNLCLDAVCACCTWVPRQRRCEWSPQQEKQKVGVSFPLSILTSHLLTVFAFLLLHLQSVKFPLIPGSLGVKHAGTVDMRRTSSTGFKIIPNARYRTVIAAVRSSKLHQCRDAIVKV
jgi:hypothetical protein